MHLYFFWIERNQFIEPPCDLVKQRHLSVHVQERSSQDLLLRFLSLDLIGQSQSLIDSGLKFY